MIPGATSEASRAGWLELLDDLFADETIAHLERIGVAPGASVLEVGAGRGSVAAWLAAAVGAAGRVVATDIDLTHFEPEAPNLQVLRHDVLEDEFEAESFDLVHCRSVLVLLSDPARALERMVRWLRPGGVLLAEEPWIDAGRLNPEPLLARVVHELEVAAPHLDGGFARRLPAALRVAGLEAVEARGRIEFFNGGDARASFYGRALRQYARALVAAGRLDRAELASVRDRVADPDWIDCGWPRIAASGRKPGRPNTRK